MVVVGTLINGAAIVAGGLAGVTMSKQLSPATQGRLKILLGAFVVYAGLSLTWRGLGIGDVSIGTFLKRFTVTMLAMMLGNLTGKVIGIQRRANGLGQYARQKFTEAKPENPNRLGDGLVTCSLLFCVGPMAILGAIQDGLGNPKILIIKAVMDGLATMAFTATFGWGVILSAIPVVAYQGTITIFARSLGQFLEQYQLVDPLNAVGGMLIFSTALVILEIKRVDLADYLPSLIYGPLLAWWWK